MKSLTQMGSELQTLTVFRSRKLDCYSDLILVCVLDSNIIHCIDKIVRYSVAVSVIWIPTAVQSLFTAQSKPNAHLCIRLQSRKKKKKKKKKKNLV